MPLQVDIQYDRLSLPLQALSRKQWIIQKNGNHIENWSADILFQIEGFYVECR